MRKVISGFSNYECDEDGNVYTIEHTTMRCAKHRSDGSDRIKHPSVFKARLKKQTLNNCGYLFCCVVNDENKRVSLYQHRAVWISFNGPIPKGFEVDHMDEVKTNNKIENLQLVTRSQNCKLNFIRRKQKLGYV